MSSVRQATAVAIGQRAILIEGPPGSGKSSLALALIDRGATLIGDDGVVLVACEGCLMTSPHPQTRGLLEVRNVGLVPMPVCEEAQACLHVLLDAKAPRYIDGAAPITIEGISLPSLSLWPDTPVLALRTEIALDRYGIVPD